MTEKKLTMKDYVLETPSVVLYNAEHSEELTKQLTDLYLEKEYRSIWIIASGSSYNGALCARTFLERHLHTTIKIITPFTFVQYEHNFTDEDFLIVCSQGGQSTNSIAALNFISSMNHITIGLVGNKESEFRYHCDHIIEWGVGIEKVGMVTKGVVTLAEFFILFALEVNKAKGIMTPEEVQNWKQEIIKTTVVHEELQKSTFQYIDTHQKELLSIHNVWLVSAGSNLSTCVEGALKIGESVKVHASSYEVEEFLHGPCYPMNPDYTVIFFDNNDHSRARIQEVYYATKEVSRHTILVTSDPAIEDTSVIKANTEIKEELNPLAYLAVCPLLAEYASETLQSKNHPLYEIMKKKVVTKAIKR